jgi:hypothetical protein
VRRVHLPIMRPPLFRPRAALPNWLASDSMEGAR